MSYTTLQELLAGLADGGDAPALVTFAASGEQRFTYRQLAAAVERLAGGLRALGLAPGQRVGLLAENRPQWIIAALAVIRAGGVAMPLDVQLDQENLARIVADSGARFFFTTAAQLPRFAALEPALQKELQPLLLADAGQATAAPAGLRPPLALAAVAARGAEGWPAVASAPGDNAVLFYTSGTTGPPKGVPLSHANLAFQLNAVGGLGLVEAGDRVLLPLPLHHVYPLVIGLLVPLARGLPLIIPEAPTGPRLRQALQAGAATVMIGVPRLYQAMYDGIVAEATAGWWPARLYFRGAAGLALFGQRRLGWPLGRWLLAPLHRRLGPSLRLLAVGGSALEPALADHLQALGWRLAIGYGLTETAPLLTVNPPTGRRGSAGRPVPGVELRLAEPVAPATHGEVQARGPGIFAGYWQLPAASAAAFTADGWFKTGDLGFFDADGYLYLAGRASTLIVTAGGKNIQPEPLEEELAIHPLIREAAVLLVDGRLAVLLVPQLAALRQAGEADSEVALRRALQAQTRLWPSYRRPAEYVVDREALPRTRLGKLRRHLLAERYRQARRERQSSRRGRPLSMAELSDFDRALLDEPTALLVWQWLCRRYPDHRLSPDTSPQLDLGVDSLEWLNLATELGRQADLELPEEVIGRIDTVRDLLTEVAHLSRQGQGFTELDPLAEPEAVLGAEYRRWLEPLRPLQVALAWLLYQLNRGLARGIFRLRVSGLENLPATGPVVFTPNHASFLDPFVLAAALPFATLRRTRFAGLGEIAFANPLFRFVCRLAQGVPIDPRRAAASSLAVGSLILRRGENLVWFPEGERSPSGRLLAFRPGIGLLLHRYRVAAVPVAIRGAYEVLPRHRYRPRWHRLRIDFGPPAGPAELAGAAGGEEITRGLRQRVKELLHGTAR